ncbi:MAG: hypothetical protein R2780_05775 [Crocinitomicaceae bacterium]
MKNWLLLILVVVLAVSCKKEPLPELPDGNYPYYSVKGYVDGEYTEMKVGQEGIHISQGTSELNGMTTYYGQIISPSEDLMIRIEFIRPEVNVTSQGYSAFNLSNIGLLVHEQGCYSAHFGSNLQQLNFVQVQNDQGVFSPLSEISFDEYGVYNLALKFTDLGNSTFNIPVKYGFVNSMINAGFSVSSNGDSTYFSANDPELAHEWIIDFNLQSEEANFGLPLSNGIHQVVHYTEDEYGNIATYTTLVRITNNNLDWKLSLDNCVGSGSMSSQFGKIIVTASKAGTTYRSDHTVENLSNSFSISGVEYIGNSSLMPDRAVFDFHFKALLVNQSNTDSLSLNAMSGTFNVGLK